MSGGVTFYQDWDLEGSGNWSRLDDNGRVETQNHTDFNEINQRTVSSQNATPTHDKNGNMTDTGFSVVGGQNFPGGKRRLEFDALNRVRKVYDNNNTTTTSDDTLLAEYIYDCGNRRLQKVVTNSGSLNGTTRFYYLGWRVMEERDGSDAILQQYCYGLYLDEVWTRDDRRSSITVAQLNDGSGTHRVFCHANTLYSVHGITDEAGALVEAYQFDAYGKQTVITDGNDGDTIVNFGANDVRTAGGNSTFTNPYMFTGQRFDPETGIMYYKMRYYSFDMGRFLSRDPIGGLFLYEYCSDNPIGRLDGLGLQDTPPKKNPYNKRFTNKTFEQGLDLLWLFANSESSGNPIIEGFKGSILGWFTSREVFIDSIDSVCTAIEHPVQTYDQAVESFGQTVLYIDDHGWGYVTDTADALAYWFQEDPSRFMAHTSFTALSIATPMPKLPAFVTRYLATTRLARPIRGLGWLDTPIQLPRPAPKAVGNTRVAAGGPNWEAGGEFILLPEETVAASGSGTIYRVPGSATRSGKPYIGRHNKSNPAKTRKSKDGRDRTKAVVIDTYDPNNIMEGRVKEQAAMDAEGGLPNLDNKRNELPKKKP